eukprot:12380823-Alexandrium_andersonii.AAC.1
MPKGVSARPTLKLTSPSKRGFPAPDRYAWVGTASGRYRRAGIEVQQLFELLGAVRSSFGVPSCKPNRFGYISCTL